MDPAAADFYEEDGKDLDFYDFERLPTLPEDEVSPHPKVGPHLTFPDGGVRGEFPGRVPPAPPSPWARSWQQGDSAAGLTAPHRP